MVGSGARGRLPEVAPAARAAFERFLRARAESPAGCDFERFVAGEDPALAADLRRLRTADRLIEAELGALGRGSSWSARSRARSGEASSKSGDAGRSEWRELRRTDPFELESPAPEAVGKSRRARPSRPLRRALRLARRRPAAGALALLLAALLLAVALAALRVV